MLVSANGIFYHYICTYLFEDDDTNSKQSGNYLKKCRALPTEVFSHLSHFFEPHTKYLSTATLINLPTQSPKVWFFLNRPKTLLYQVEIKTKHQEITSVSHVSLWFSLYLVLSLLAKGLAACYSVSWDPTQLLLAGSHSSSLTPRVPRSKMALPLTRHELFLQRPLLQKS